MCDWDRNLKGQCVMKEAETMDEGVCGRVSEIHFLRDKVGERIRRWTKHYRGCRNITERVHVTDNLTLWHRK